MASVKFEREFTHRVDDDTRKTWPMGWSGEVGDDVAKAARKAEAAAYWGEGAAENEAAYQAELEAEAAAAADADKKAGKGKNKELQV
jgi:hypothetical protein